MFPSWRRDRRHLARLAPHAVVQPHGGRVCVHADAEVALAGRRRVARAALAGADAEREVPRQGWVGSNTLGLKRQVERLLPLTKCFEINGLLRSLAIYPNVLRRKSRDLNGDQNITTVVEVFFQDMSEVKR